MLSVIFCLLPVDSFATSKQVLKQQQLDQLRNKISILKQQLDDKHSKKSALASELEQTETQIADIARLLFHTNTQIAQLIEELTTLNQQTLSLRSRLELQQQLLSEQIRASYSIGRQEYIKLLLNQQDPVIISRIMTYYNYFNQARSAQISQVNDLLHQIDINKQKIGIKNQVLATKQQSLQQEKQMLEQNQFKRSQLLEQLANEIIFADQKLTNLLENEKQLSSLLQQLQKALDDIPNLPTGKPFNKLRGSLTWPVKGRVRKLYNHWRSMDKVRWHGVIIVADEGEPVFAVSHGRIAYADWLRGYGLIIIIDHGHGYMSLYGHNQTLLKEVGDWVETDEIIATVGRSGGLSKTGLYFEIRHDGKASNPTRWCKKQRRYRG